MKPSIGIFLWRICWHWPAQWHVDGWTFQTNQRCWNGTVNRECSEFEDVSAQKNGSKSLLHTVRDSASLHTGSILKHCKQRFLLQRVKFLYFMLFSSTLMHITFYLLECYNFLLSCLIALILISGLNLMGWGAVKICWIKSYLTCWILMWPL